MTYCEARDLDEFLTTVRSRGLDSVVVAWQDEYAQAPDLAAVEYRRVRRSVVLAYDGGDGAIVRVILDDDVADRTRLRERLIAAGLVVEERCRNTTAFDANRSSRRSV